LTKDILLDVDPGAYTPTYISKVAEALGFPRVLASDRLELLFTTTVDDLSSNGTLPAPLLDAIEQCFLRMISPDARFVAAVYIREGCSPEERIRRLVRLIDRAPDDTDMLIFESVLAIKYLDPKLLGKPEEAGPMPKDKAGWIERVRAFVQ
jgi:hypothetical protein